MISKDYQSVMDSLCIDTLDEFDVFNGERFGYGTDCYVITDEDIEKLKNGLVLVGGTNMGEYMFLVGYKSNESD